MTIPRLPASLAAALAVGAVLRLAAASYGLPAVFNSDEPHLVNVAVSFAGGSLNPHLFKYPTLWMYLLFAAYGVFFVLWSGFGLAHSVADFGRLFAWDPTAFYLIARALAALLSTAALVWVFRAGRDWLGEAAGASAALLLAVSPVLVEAAHASKPESLMFLLAAVAWWASARYVAEGRARDLAFAGAAAGLSLSSQYTAAPLGVLVPAAWGARRLANGDASLGALALGCVLAPAAFLAGSPFIALDFATFREGVAGFRQMDAAGSGPVGPWPVLKNIFTFAGPWLPGLALVAGAARVLGEDRPRALWLLAPAFAFLAALSASSEGAWQRYLLAAFPGLALLAGAGVDWALRWAGEGGPAWTRTKGVAALLAALLAAPGAWAASLFDRQLLLPDTRTLSAAWIEQNIPAGSAVLMDQEHASPRLPMSREQAGKLLERTEREGHPKARYYRYLLEGHTGGGYEVYRVLRDYRDLRSYPGHVAFSAAGQPMLDVREGLSAALAAGVRFVVLTSYGASLERSPLQAQFLEEVRQEGALLQLFEPAPGRAVGPRIEVYRVDTAREAPRGRGQGSRRR